MSTDFQDRIARLNAKNGVQPTETPPPPNGGSGDGPRGPRDKGPKGSMGKYILLGILILVVMPIGAAMGTIYFAQNKDRLADATTAVKNTAFGLSVLKTMHVDGNDDPAIREARNSITSLRLRHAMGTITKEEAEYYGTLEGEMALAAKVRKAYNFDKMTEQAKAHYGK